jgi:hypothetical protein
MGSLSHPGGLFHGVTDLSGNRTPCRNQVLRSDNLRWPDSLDCYDCVLWSFRAFCRVVVSVEVHKGRPSYLKPVAVVKFDLHFLHTNSALPTTVGAVLCALVCVGSAGLELIVRVIGDECWLGCSR